MVPMRGANSIEFTPLFLFPNRIELLRHVRLAKELRFTKQKIIVATQRKCPSYGEALGVLSDVSWTQLLLAQNHFDSRLRRVPETF